MWLVVSSQFQNLQIVFSRNTTISRDLQFTSVVPTDYNYLEQATIKYFWFTLWAQCLHSYVLNIEQLLLVLFHHHICGFDSTKLFFYIFQLFLYRTGYWKDIIQVYSHSLLTERYGHAHFTSRSTVTQQYTAVSIICHNQLINPINPVYKKKKLEKIQTVSFSANHITLWAQRVNYVQYWSRVHAVHRH